MGGLAEDRPALAHHLDDGHGVRFADGVVVSALAAFHAGAHHPVAPQTHRHPPVDMACDIDVQQPHVLVLTGPCEDCEATDHAAPCVNDQHSYDYAVECPGVTDACRMYRECTACSVRAAAGLPPEADEETGMGHGVPHRRIGGLWMTPTDDCYVQTIDGLADAVADLNLSLGRYLIDHDFPGDPNSLLLFALTDALPA